jgi:hypothetical protein
MENYLIGSLIAVITFIIFVAIIATSITVGGQLQDQKVVSCIQANHTPLECHCAFSGCN